MTLNIAAVIEAVREAFPERAALVHGDTRMTFSELGDRGRRFANFLLGERITIETERASLKNWQIGQDRVALYMHNCPEYLEAMLGAFMARAVPINVNYRYVGEELLYLFGDARPKAVVFQARFAKTLAGVLPRLPWIETLVQVDDGSGQPLLPGAVDYETVLAGTSPARPMVDLSPDDIYCVYTGGTTGMPKGVLWRQADSLYANLGGRLSDGTPIPTAAGFVDRARKSGGHRVLPAPPFMHGAGTQVALSAWCAGNTVVIQDEVATMVAADLWRTVETERVNMMLIIGDAYGRPLLEDARSGTYDLSSLRFIYNTGAILMPEIKLGLLQLMPDLRLVDALGSTETGPQATRVSSNKTGNPGDAKFDITGDSAVLNEDRTRLLQEGHDGLGWLAKKGAVPLGYLGDEAKTRETFPKIGGTRYVVGGDRVRWLENGEIEFHGRESFTINSGGEKIFAEEVECAIKQHPDVVDVVVTGRPSERWGSEVVAIVHLKNGKADCREALLAESAKHIARYKLPKAFLFTDAIQRGPSGKTDNRWAQSVAGAAT